MVTVFPPLADMPLLATHSVMHHLPECLLEVRRCPILLAFFILVPLHLPQCYSTQLPILFRYVAFT